MNASVMLANFAKVSDGMLDVQAAGWTQIGPGPISFFVAGLVFCDWDELNQRHELKAELLDADRQPVPNPADGEAIHATAEWEMGRPPGIKPGTTLVMPFAIPFGVFELEAGVQYVVQVSIDGDPRDQWRLPFTVRDAPPQSLAA
jgi:Family of unknown function (DUF6941)